MRTTKCTLDGFEFELMYDFTGRYYPPEEIYPVAYWEFDLEWDADSERLFSALKQVMGEDMFTEWFDSMEESIKEEIQIEALEIQAENAYERNRTACCVDQLDNNLKCVIIIQII